MNIEIDSGSGFCFGVVTAIRKAEEELDKGNDLYCLGDIVHNSDEVERLRRKGLKVITHEELAGLKNARVLLRAHGEPPATYQTARANNINICDATCPVVLRLQQRIKQSYDAPAGLRPQIVIYGKRGHAEVNGLVGQTEGTAIVIEGTDQLDLIDYSRPIALYSQTTKSVSGFHEIIEAIRSRVAPGVEFNYYDTICRQVAGRFEKLQQFAAAHDLVVFVAGEKSSNGKVLFSKCLEVNPRSIFISNAEGLSADAVKGADNIGICGATSTPRWLMEQVAEKIHSLTT